MRVSARNLAYPAMPSHSRISAKGGDLSILAQVTPRSANRHIKWDDYPPLL